MLLQVNNRVILLEAVNYASIEFPGEDTENDWIELLLIVNGKDLVVTGDEALTLWHTITRNAHSLIPSPLLEQAEKSRAPITEAS